MTAFVAFRKNFWYEREGAQIFFFFFLLELLSLLKNFFSSKEKKKLSRKGGACEVPHSSWLSVEWAVGWLGCSYREAERWSGKCNSFEPTQWDLPSPTPPKSGSWVGEILSPQGSGASGLVVISLFSSCDLVAQTWPFSVGPMPWEGPGRSFLSCSGTWVEFLHLFGPWFS